MHYSAGFTLLLVVLLASPLSVSAQAEEEGASSEPTAQEPVSEPAPEEPALQLEVDDAGVDVTPSPPRTPKGYTLEQAELRVKGARTGLAVSAGVGVLSIALSGGWIACVNRKPSSDTDLFPPECNGLLGAGLVMGLASAIGMITSGALLGVRKRKLRELQQAQGTIPRRAQWNLARSRLVF